MASSLNSQLSGFKVLQSSNKQTLLGHKSIGALIINLDAQTVGSRGEFLVEAKDWQECVSGCGRRRVVKFQVLAAVTSK